MVTHHRRYALRRWPGGTWVHEDDSLSATIHHDGSVIFGKGAKVTAPSRHLVPNVRLPGVRPDQVTEMLRHGRRVLGGRPGLQTLTPPPDPPSAIPHRKYPNADTCFDRRYPDVNLCIEEERTNAGAEGSSNSAHMLVISGTFGSVEEWLTGRDPSGPAARTKAEFLAVTADFRMRLALKTKVDALGTGERLRAQLSSILRDDGLTPTEKKTLVFEAWCHASRARAPSAREIERFIRAEMTGGGRAPYGEDDRRRFENECDGHSFRPWDQVPLAPPGGPR